MSKIFVLLLVTFPIVAADQSQRCATCHPKETARYLASPMGRSLVPPEQLPPGRITHERSGSVITIEERTGRMIHKLSEQGLTAEYPVRYQIGSTFMGRTYMVQIGDHLFESPATWFNRYGWDLSPGYASMPLIDFDRPMEESCLFCHAGAARFSDTDGRRLENTQLTAISCDRCHGPADAHLQHPSANSIVNPPRLAGAARDSVCEQCHLEGAVRVLNPRKSWIDFHLGEPTERTFATYLLRGGNSQDVIAVSQAEQLGESKCERASGGKLWCGSCHNPHGESGNRQQEVRAVCIGCHAALSAAAHPAGTNTPECTSCHMPRNSTTDIPHAALTDHRILRRPSEGSRIAPGEPHVTVWREPPPENRERDFAVAQVLIGYTKALPAITSDGFRHLVALPLEQQQNDPMVLSHLEGYSMQQNDIEKALAFGRRSVELQPQSAKAAMNFGIVLKRAGDLAEAERQLTRAINLDPSLKQAYTELATLYASQGKTHEMAETIDRFLNWNPQDILFRLQKARVSSQ